MAESASMARRRLGRELRRLRDRAGLSARAAASETGGRWSQARLTRMETGHPAVVLRPSDMGVLCDVYGCAHEERAEVLALVAAETGDGAWIVRAGGASQRQREISFVESSTKSVRQYLHQVVPGLFQSPAYTRALLTTGGESDVTAVLDGRARRQQRLREPGGPNWDIVLEEAALRNAVVPPSALAEQCDRLIADAALPAVSLRVIPTAAQRTGTSPISFLIYDFESPDSPAVVYVETPTLDLYLSAASDLTRYNAVFSRVASDALSVDETTSFLAEMSKEFAGATAAGPPERNNR
jgi:hypothetical protein